MYKQLTLKSTISTLGSKCTSFSFSEVTFEEENSEDMITDIKVKTLVYIKELHSELLANCMGVDVSANSPVCFVSEVHINNNVRNSDNIPYSACVYVACFRFCDIAMLF